MGEPPLTYSTEICYITNGGNIWLPKFSRIWHLSDCPEKFVSVRGSVVYPTRTNISRQSVVCQIWKTTLKKIMVGFPYCSLHTKTNFSFGGANRSGCASITPKPVVSQFTNILLQVHCVVLQPCCNLERTVLGAPLNSFYQTSKHCPIRQYNIMLFSFAISVLSI